MALGNGDVVRLSANIKDPRGADCITTWDVQILTTGSGGNTGFREDAREYLEALFDPMTDFIKSTAQAYQIGFYHRTGTEVLVPLGWTAPDFNDLDDELPLGTSGLVIGRTNTRRVMARKYLPCPTENRSDGGAPSNAYTDALEDLCLVWQAPFTGSNGWDLQAVVWSDTGNTAYDLLECLPSTKWAIQRRRRLGRGS